MTMRLSAMLVTLRLSAMRLAAMLVRLMSRPAMRPELDSEAV